MKNNQDDDNLLKTLVLVRQEYVLMIKKCRPSMWSRFLDKLLRRWPEQYGYGLCHISKKVFIWHDITIGELTAFKGLLDKSFPRTDIYQDHVWPLTEAGHKRRLEWLDEQISNLN